MKTCAMCQLEYAETYDACPRCAVRKKARNTMLASAGLMFLAIVLTGANVYVVGIAAIVGLVMLIQLVGRSINPDFGLQSELDKIPGYAEARPARPETGTMPCPVCGKTNPLGRERCQWCYKRIPA